MVTSVCPSNSIRRFEGTPGTRPSASARRIAIVPVEGNVSLNENRDEKTESSEMPDESGEQTCQNV